MRPLQMLAGVCATAACLAAEPAAAAATLHYEVSGHLIRQTTESVPADIDTFLQTHFDGQTVHLSFDLNPATADINPSATSADYRGAVTASSLHIGGVEMLQMNYCGDTSTIDCSVVLANDLPAFGGLMDSYWLRSRNFELASGTPLDNMVHLLSFLFSGGQFSNSGAPAMLASTALDPGLDALIGGRPQDFSINLQQSGGCSSCLFASWGIDQLQIRLADEPALGVAEPGAALLAATALVAAGGFSRRRRRA